MANAVITIQRGADAPVDFTGNSNEVSFNIEGAVSEKEVFGQVWTEHLPGGAKWSLDISVYYDAGAGGLNEYLVTMFTEQHGPDSGCSTVPDYVITLYPNGNCAGQDKWTLEKAIITKMPFTVKRGEAIVIKASFVGGAATREVVV